MNKLSVNKTLLKAKSYGKKGEVEQAQKLYQAVLREFPKNNRAQEGLASLGEHKKSIVMQGPPQETINQLFNLYNQGNLKVVIEQAKMLIAQYPKTFTLWNILGAANQRLGRNLEASEAFRKVIELNPANSNGFNNLGVTLKDQGKIDEAIMSYKKALSLNPEYVSAHTNMGAALKDQGKFDEAIMSYRKALSLEPGNANAFFNMGVTLQDQGKLDEAIVSYEKVISLKPEDANVHNNMGAALKDQGKFDEAIEAYNKALAIKPDFADAYYNIGNALQKQSKPKEVIEAYRNALVIMPDFEVARTQKLYQQALICNWDDMAEDTNLIPQLGTNEKDVPPFDLLSLEDAPDRHFSRSKVYAKANYSQNNLPPIVKSSKRSKRIRIGYFSTDYKEHPVAYLIAKVLKKHNRNKFEVFGYSIHGSSSCEMRQQLKKSFDSFTDIQSMSDRDIALQVRRDEIDIAIDLNGYTQHARTGIFANRAAPIQINFLGYPGTLGADFIDYIVADPVLIPEDNRQHYLEQIIYLPNTYQPTDNTRTISNKVITRKDMGLPDGVFVFCCFNNNYKISPAEFDIWMRLLDNVEGSVLWLLRSNKWAEQNLKQQAEARGIRSERIIFAEKLPQAEHLARQRLADLFLDTFNYNAHTTASDALWVGLPIVTKLGKGFAARVAGSLLNAVGLPELITKTEQDYEALILKLATNPTKLDEIKEKLANNRLTQPLFNTELYTKQLEEGYQEAYQNHFEGNPPQTIIVPK